jgi:tetratricopeptide (TPR) repeat protein
MHKDEVDLFVKGLENAKSEFYLDSINKFKKLIKDFPDSELCDDAVYNIGLCYFYMQQFQKAIESFEKVINYYPDSTISILEGGNEFGKTAAKSFYGIINCYLAVGDIEKAKLIIPKINNYENSYIITNDKKVLYKELSLTIIEKYKLTQ